MHHYVGCGTTITGAGADIYRIEMSLMSYLSWTNPGAPVKVQTQLIARGEDMGTSKGWIACLTTGALEEKVNQMLLQRIRQ